MITETIIFIVALIMSYVVFEVFVPSVAILIHLIALAVFLYA